MRRPRAWPRKPSACSETSPCASRWRMPQPLSDVLPPRTTLQRISSRWRDCRCAKAMRPRQKALVVRPADPSVHRQARPMFRGRVRHVHFVGIGGIGMSGLAEVLRTLEFDVTGSDVRANDNTRRLETLGVRVSIGHRAENVSGADVVVYSSAIADENPEIVRARVLEVPIIPRAEMLA